MSVCIFVGVVEGMFVCVCLGVGVGVSLSVSVCMYVYVYVCVCVCIHTASLWCDEDGAGVNDRIIFCLYVNEAV